VLVRGLVRFNRGRTPTSEADPENVRHFQFYTPRTLEQRARQRVRELLDHIYGRDLAPGWEADVVIQAVEAAPDEMAGHPEQFLPAQTHRRSA
jgi:hypothetical protein